MSEPAAALVAPLPPASSGERLAPDPPGVLGLAPNLDGDRAPTSPADLLGVLAQAVLAVAGVVRLEPTLSTSGPGFLLHRSPTDGLHLLVHAGTADVDVNVATTAGVPARAVAHQVQAGIAGVLSAHGHLPGAVTVSVLAIEPR